MIAPNYTISNNEQLSEMWLAEKAGVLSASNASVMITPTLKVSKSEGAKRLVRKIIWEQKNGYCLDLLLPKSVTKSMRNGTELEPFAFLKFAELPENLFNDWSRCGFVRRNGIPIGCSPDGAIIENGKILEGVEIKCPDSVDSFIDVFSCENSEDLRVSKFDWWAQIQFSLFITGAERWYFFAYVLKEYQNSYVELYKKIQVMPSIEAFNAFEAFLVESGITKIV